MAGPITTCLSYIPPELVHEFLSFVADSTYGTRTLSALSEASVECETMLAAPIWRHRVFDAFKEQLDNVMYVTNLMSPAYDRLLILDGDNTDLHIATEATMLAMFSRHVAYNAYLFESEEDRTIFLTTNKPIPFRRVDIHPSKLSVIMKVVTGTTPYYSSRAHGTDLDDYYSPWFLKQVILNNWAFFKPSYNSMSKVSAFVRRCKKSRVLIDHIYEEMVSERTRMSFIRSLVAIGVEGIALAYNYDTTYIIDKNPLCFIASTSEYIRTVGNIRFQSQQGWWYLFDGTEDCPVYAKMRNYIVTRVIHKRNLFRELLFPNATPEDIVAYHAAGCPAVYKY